jgi:hypothetical protein
MRYIKSMRYNHPDLQLFINETNINGKNVKGAIFGSTKRGIPFVPGLLLILLGVVLVAAPRLLLAAIAVCLVTLGALFCYVAYRFISIRKQINTLSKDFERSLYTGNFQDGKPDIDISEFENKKIILH